VERLLQREPTDVLTQNSAVQHEDETTEDHEVDGNGDELQQLDDMVGDEQETDANDDDQSPAEPESHGNATTSEDVDCPCPSARRYNLRDPSTRRPPSKHK